jgi:hypothetical protein
MDEIMSCEDNERLIAITLEQGKQEREIVERKRRIEELKTECH